MSDIAPVDPTPVDPVGLSAGALDMINTARAKAITGAPLSAEECTMLATLAGREHAVGQGRPASPWLLADTMAALRALHRLQRLHRVGMYGDTPTHLTPG